MKIGSIGNFLHADAKSLYTVKQIKKAEPSVTRSVREEVLARRKKQKSFSVIDMIKTNIENRINEKIVDILDIRFV